jgi:dipeptidyl aminopeptidase/acylaminoacyl peptidase
MGIRVVWGYVLTAILAVALGCGWAQGEEQATGVAADAGSGGRPMTFADLQRMRRLSDPQISPSGKWVMFSVVDVDLEKNSKVSHLWVVPLSASRAAGAAANASSVEGSSAQERQVTFWKEGESGGRFSPNGRQVSFIATESSTGLSQIFLASWDEASGTLGAPQRLTNVGTEADGAIWSPDSKRLMFASRVYPECSYTSLWLEEDACNRGKDAAAAASPVKAQIWDHLLYKHWDHYVGPKRSHVLVVAAADGNAVRDLTPSREIGDAEAPTFSLGGPLGYAWAPDSKEMAFVANVEAVPAASTNNDVFSLRLDDPGAEPVRISTSPGSDDGPAYSPDGRYLAFRSQERAGFESDRFRLMLFERSMKTARELLPKFDRWVDEFVWAPDSKTIYFASGESGQEPVLKTTVEGPDAGKVGLQANLGEYGDLRVSPDGRAVVATRMRVTRPAEIVSVTTQGTHSLGQDSTVIDVTGLTGLNRSLLAELDLPKMESYWFTGAEGAKVQGFLIRPPNFDPSRKYPLKFLMHGGPQTAWGDAWSYRWNAELLAADGYVVVMINRRGSTGYGQKFVDEVSGDWGGKAYVDLMKGLDFVEAKYPFIDKTRECALGASYGGFMADWVLTHTNRFACIVTHDGMFNPQSAYGTTEELWFNEWEFRRPGDAEPAQPWRYAAGPVANDPFRKWSPMLSIQSAKTPTLVIHSQRDYRLDVSEGFQLFTALQRLGVPSRMLYFPDEGHWVLKPQNSKLWYETVNDWCDRWTKTNGYAVNSAYVPVRPAPRAAAMAAPIVPEARTGRSQPSEMDETQPLPNVTKPAPTAPAGVAKAAPIVEAPRSMAQAPEHSRAGAERAAFSITINAPQDEVQVGMDARVSITLKNLSDQQILFGHRPGRDNPEFSYKIEVRNAAGQVVEETAYGRGTAQGPGEDRTVDYVQPGGTAAQTAHLTKLVNLTRPGRYTVQVSRKDTLNQGVVRSNKLTLKVVP